MRSTLVFKFETLAVAGPYMYADAWVHEQDTAGPDRQVRAREVEAEGGDRVRSPCILSVLSRFFRTPAALACHGWKMLDWTWPLMYPWSSLYSVEEVPSQQAHVHLLFKNRMGGEDSEVDWAAFGGGGRDWRSWWNLEFDCKRLAVRNTLLNSFLYLVRPQRPLG